MYAIATLNNGGKTAAGCIDSNITHSQLGVSLHGNYGNIKYILAILQAKTSNKRRRELVYLSKNM